jgi:alpha-tubulin suppressor-like RCC1 family protein
MTRTRKVRPWPLLVVVGVAGCDGNPFEPASHPVSYIAVEAGGGHSCGLAIGGEVYCWGRGGNGQLGDGRAARSADPVRAGGAGAIYTSVTLGQHHTCAVTDDGRAHCWGWNRWGQLGVGTTDDMSSPQFLPAQLVFATLSAGFHHTCGLTPSGEAWCWGDNSQGQLGDGTTTHATSPVRVAGDLVFARISAGGYHTCGLTHENEAYCWGLNYLGQLGTGDTGNRAAPTAVVGADAFEAISAGGMHTCAVAADGRALCWGSARYGELGTGHVASAHAADLPVVAPTAVHRHRSEGDIAFVEIGAGLHFTCGTDTGGRAWCWGLGYDGQLGGNELGVRATPSPVFATLDMRFTGVSAGHGTHACGITDSFGAYCWGTSPDGGLGPGSTFSMQPVRVPGPR